jgi:hypothetical protein
VYIAACAWWLNQKLAKSSNLTQSRRTSIERLMKAAIAELSELSQGQGAFAARKADAIRTGFVQGKQGKGHQGTATISLSGGYQNERAAYLHHQKPDKTVAGSKVIKLANKAGVDFDSMSTTQFIGMFEQSLAKMSEQGVRKHMVQGMADYLPRADRVQYLLVPHGKTFATVDGKLRDSLVKTTGFFFADMYAMDRYGNLFVRTPVTDVNASWFNHSSFNAGNEVICAGMIIFNKGRLLHIDNLSGHYKPDKAALHACLLALRAQGADVDEVRVGVVTADDMVFHLGESFLRDPNGKADWDPRMNANRKLPDCVI